MVDALGYFGNNGIISLIVTPFGSTTPTTSGRDCRSTEH